MLTIGVSFLLLKKHRQKHLVLKRRQILAMTLIFFSLYLSLAFAYGTQCIIKIFKKPKYFKPTIFPAIGMW